MFSESSMFLRKKISQNYIPLFCPENGDSRGSSEIFVYVYQATRCHITEGRGIYIHRRHT